MCACCSLSHRGLWIWAEQQGKPLGTGCQVLCSSYLAIMDQFCLSYLLMLFSHIILHLHISLEDLVESCIPTALNSVVGFRCRPNPASEHCSSAVSQDTFLNKQKGKTHLDLFYSEGQQMPLQKQPPHPTREHRETN